MVHWARPGDIRQCNIFLLIKNSKYLYRSNLPVIKFDWTDALEDEMSAGGRIFVRCCHALAGWSGQGGRSDMVTSSPFPVSVEVTDCTLSLLCLPDNSTGSTGHKCLTWSLLHLYTSLVFRYQISRAALLFYYRHNRSLQDNKDKQKVDTADVISDDSKL